MRETAKTMLVFLCTGIILVAAIVANSKYEEWRAEKVAAEVLRQQEAQTLPESTQGSVTIYMNDGTVWGYYGEITVTYDSAGCPDVTLKNAWLVGSTHPDFQVDGLKGAEE